jgi:lipopolysaccharide transport system permease protein
MIILFATPIFYPVDAVPSLVQGLTAFNPIYIISSAYRATLLGGQAVPLISLFVLAFLSLALLILALGAFRRVKGYFPSVV